MWKSKQPVNQSRTFPHEQQFHNNGKISYGYVHFTTGISSSECSKPATASPAATTSSWSCTNLLECKACTGQVVSWGLDAFP